MSPRAWIGLCVGVVVLIAVGGAAAGGFYWWDSHRVSQWRARAVSEYEAGHFPKAISLFEWYLPRVPSDTDALLKYADAAQQIISGRSSMLQKAAIAYLQYLEYEPDDLATKKRLLEVYAKMESWLDMQHSTDVFLEEHPDEPTLLYYRALASDKIDSRPEAIAAYRDLIDRGVAPPQVHADLARLLVRENAPEEAERVLSEALEKHADDAAVHVAVAEYYLERNELDRAAPVLARAEQLAPDDTEVLQARAQLALLQKDLKSGIAYAEKALTVAPKSPDAKLMLARAYALDEQPTKAVQALSGMEPLDRVDRPEALILWVDLLFGLNELDEAKIALDEYRSAYPQHQAVVDYFTARDLLARGDADGAIEILRYVVQKRPGFYPAQYFLAYAQLQSEDPSQRAAARTTLSMYLTQNPGDARAEMLFAAHFNPPSPEEAAAKAQEALESDNASPRDLVNAGRMLVNSVQNSGENDPQWFETLRRTMETAIERDPTVAEAYRVLADIDVLEKDYNGARATLARARAAGVADSELARTEANLALAEGKAEAAKAHFDTFLQAGRPLMSDLLDWVDFFASRRQLELARYVLGRGRETIGQDAGASLWLKDAEVSAALDPVDLALKTIDKDREQALATLPPAEPGAGVDDSLRASVVDRINDAYLEVARRLIVDGGPEGVEQAKAIVARVRQSQPNNAAALALEAQMLLQQEPPKLAEAEVLLEEALAIESASPMVLLGLSRLESLRGEMTRALEYADRAAEAAPNAVPVLLQRARLLMNLQRRPEAQALLDRILRSDATNRPALQLAVENCIDNGWVPQARELLDTLKETAGGSPDVAGALAMLEARLLMAEGKGTEAGEALEVLRAQHEATPDDFSVLSNYAAMLASQGRAAEAEALYGKFLERHRDHTEGWVERARLQMARNTEEGFSEASRSLTQALLLDEKHLPALREMIRLQARRGNLPDALAYCERYLALDPREADVHYQKALLCTLLPERLPDALRAIEDALALSDQPEYRALRGLVRVGLGDFADALLDLQRVADGPNPTTAQVDLGLSQAYLATGRRDLAKEYYDSARQKVAQGQSLSRLDADRMRALANELGEESAS